MRIDEYGNLVSNVETVVEEPVSSPDSEVMTTNTSVPVETVEPTTEAVEHNTEHKTESKYTKEQWACLSSLKAILVPEDTVGTDIYLPAGRQSDILTARIKYPERLEDIPGQREAMYADMLSRGYMARTFNDLYWRRVSGEAGKDWVQAVKSEQGLLGAIRPKVASTTTKATGTAAVNRIRTLLGKGSPITIPLWHSGFYATFNSPDEDAILALYNRITTDRVSLGRKIFGAALANESAYTSKVILDFAVEHLVDTNLVNGKEDFLEKLSSLDIQHVAWGLACAMYQNGFDFARAVITEGNETLMQRGKVNVNKLQWTHYSSLTEKQLRHMHYTRTKRISDEALAMYKAEFSRGQPTEYNLNDDIKITLSVPSAIQHLDAGYSWVEGIVQLIDSSFSVEGGPRERDAFIYRQSKATQLRQFDHWVNKISIRVPGTDDWEDFERDDDQTVELILAQLSEDDSIRTTFFNLVRDYLEQSTVSIIAVTTASEVEQKEALPRFAELFPIDAVAVFTLLSTRRALLVESRETL